MKLDVVSMDKNKKVGDIELADEFFGADVRADLMHRYVTWQLAKRRAGTHKVKERNEIARTGKKFGRQKGGGGARHGSRRSNIFVGGGVVHGPRVRDHGYSLPKKVKRLALMSALSAKVAANEMIVVDAAELASAKTKDLKAALANMGSGSALIMDSGAINGNLQLAANNIVGVDCILADGANVYDILRHDRLIMTKAAAKALSARFAGEPQAQEA